jgi:hypothetical protein
MGQETGFKKVKLFAGFIYLHADIYQQVKQDLVKRFSPVDLESEVFSFDKTTYYNQEMGALLYKRFVSFSRLIGPEELPAIKLLTNKMEVDLAAGGQRVINIDPGFLSDANVILATTKNHYHRVPLTKGIYAHIEYLIKKKNTLTTLEWTYPDFKTADYMDFFIRLIPIYKQRIKELRVGTIDGGG